MIEFKITKYNPQNRLNGKYSVNEWTSISDIGMLFDSGILTYTQYMQVEQSYVDCCIDLLQKADVSVLCVESLEYYDKGLYLPNVLDTEEEIRRIIMYCLREKCWAKLENENFFIHFGYDYNMYIGTCLPGNVVQEIAEKHNLFSEKEASPYKREV